MWLKLEDDFPSSRKVRRLSDKAFRLYVTSLCFAAHDLTDGLIRTEDLVEFVGIRPRPKEISELVDAELWDPVRAGWLVHDFLDYNPSRAAVELSRSAARERQRRSRERKLRISTQSSSSPDGRETVTDSRAATVTPLVSPRASPDVTA